jgi:hypothetical protein
MASDDAGVKAWNGSGDAPKAAVRPKRSAVYMALVVVAMVVVVAVFVTIFVLPGRAHAPPPSGTVLVSSGHSYDVFGGQWSSVSFSIATSQTLRGAFSTTFGITAYVMTNVQYQQFVHSVNVTGYQWASGEVHSGSVHDSLPPGSWVLAFIDLNTQSTSVLITADVTIG